MTRKTIRAAPGSGYAEKEPLEVVVTNIINMRDKFLGCYVNVEGYKTPVIVPDEEWTPVVGETVTMHRPVDDYFYVVKKES